MPSRAGSPNKNKRFLLKRLQDMYGEDFHPIIRMAENAVKMQAVIEKIEDNDAQTKTTSLKAAVDAWDKVAQYTEPKLKAAEITASVDGEVGGKWVIEFVNASPQAKP